MITATITNYRGCQRARIECNPIALVGGRNAAGKSSIAQGVGVTLCGEVPSVLGLGRNPGAAMVRSGAGGALIEIEDERGTRRMEFPKAQVSVTADPPSATKWAAGLDSVASIPLKERADILSELLHAEPTQDDVFAKLKELGLAQHAEAIWEMIERHGWEGAERLRRERGAGMKGAWEQLTGTRYGSRIAPNWRANLSELNESELIAEVRRTETARDHAISAAAVSQDEYRRVQAEALQQEARHAAYMLAVDEVEKVEKTFALACAARDALPPATQPRYTPCPYPDCARPIEVIRDLAAVTLEMATGEILRDEELKRRRDDIADGDGKKAHANDLLNLARRKLAEAQRLLTASTDAEKVLAKWPRATESGTDVESAKAAHQRAEKHLAEFRTKLEADAIHQRIEINDTVIGMLSGEGLRREKLANVLDVFNKVTLGSLTQWAGWSPVTLGHDMALSYGGRAYALLSQSEQYRVRVVLQVAMGQVEGADLIVIDGADILDAPARGGMIVMLQKASVSALVCLTLSRPDQLPDISRSGAGTSYWVENAEARGLDKGRAAA